MVGFFFFLSVLWPLMMLTVVGSEFAIVYVVFGLWVREKIHGETVLEVGGNQSLVGLCEMGFVVYRGVKSVAGFCDGKEEQ